MASIYSIWNFDPSTTRRTLIQARREERWSKHSEKLFSLKLHPSMARRTPIQARRSKHRYSPIHKRWSVTSANPLSLSLLVCPCVGVFGYVVSVVDFVVVFFIFVVVFWFCICGSVCIKGRSRWWGRWFWRWRRERKKGVKLEIIKIMYRRAIVTVHMVTVTLVHLCTISHPMIWVFFWSKYVKWAAFCILQDYPWTDAIALTKLERTWRPSLGF